MAVLLPLLVVAAVEHSAHNATLALEGSGPHGRSTMSDGCATCCFSGNCMVAFSSAAPGVCCGTYPRTGCCPMGSSCINCGSMWRCTNSRYITAATRNSVCAAGYGYGHTGYGYGPGYGPTVAVAVPVAPVYGYGYGYGDKRETPSEQSNGTVPAVVLSLGLLALVIVRLARALPSALDLPGQRPLML